MAEDNAPPPPHDEQQLRNDGKHSIGYAEYMLDLMTANFCGCQPSLCNALQVPHRMEIALDMWRIKRLQGAGKLAWRVHSLVHVARAVRCVGVEEPPVVRGLLGRHG